MGLAYRIVNEESKHGQKLADVGFEFDIARHWDDTVVERFDAIDCQ